MVLDTAGGLRKVWTVGGFLHVTLPSDVTVDSHARDKVTRLFKFIQAFNERRNPPVRDIRGDRAWRLWLRDLPDHETISLIDYIPDDQEAEPEAGPEGSSQENERVVLRSVRPEATPPPTPPEELVDWLGAEWNDCRSNPEPRVSRNVTDDEETIVEKFDDSRERVLALEGYRALWSAWAKQEQITLAAADVFARLYELHGALQRDPDQFELLLGAGMLSWSHDNLEVFHPLLTRPLSLIFRPEVPEFMIVEASPKTNFCSAIFNGLSDIDGALIGKIGAEVDELGLHPLGTTTTPSFLRSVPPRLSREGKYVETGAAAAPTQLPVVTNSPVIFLQKRTSGLARAIASVVRAVETGGVIPYPLLDVIGAPLIEEITSDSPDSPTISIPDANADDEILFTKPGNPEQLQIARALAKENGVLVQGPPGTGKTHTIANLMGHLLAEGKTVLVTSQTSKALKVVKEKVVPELQSLCVSVIDSSEDDAALKASIDGIVERIGFVDEGRLERDILRLNNKRQELIKQLETLKHQLRSARLDEYLDIIVDGTPTQPRTAAKEVAEGVGRHDWIPSPVAPGAPLPLSVGELTRLYTSNIEITRKDETAIGAVLPDLTDFIDPDAFENLVDEIRQLEASELDLGTKFWDAPTAEDVSSDSLEPVFEEVRGAVDVVGQMPPWSSKLVEVGLLGHQLAMWDGLVAEIEQLVIDFAPAKELIVTYSPQISNKLEPEKIAKVYKEIAKEIERTGRVPGFLSRLTHKDWDVALDDSKINESARPRSREHFEALAEAAAITHRRLTLVRRWKNLVEAIGGPSIDAPDAEEASLRYVRLLRSGLGWSETKWLPALGNLQACGLNWEAVLTESAFRHADHGEFARIREITTSFLPEIIAAERNRRRLAELKAEHENLLTNARGWPKSELAVAMIASITLLNAGEFRRCHAEITRLGVLSRAAHDRRELLERLDALAPGWADVIRHRAGSHGEGTLPGEPRAAWRWRLFQDELDRRSAVSLPALGQQIEETRREITQTTIDLVDRKAWLFQKKRLTHKERAALFGFAAAKRMYGRGTGKKAARLLAEQRRTMSEARSAVPVWIMSIAKAVEVFDPETSRFDVVIIDEASQSDVTSLVALYLGKKVLVVGDDEQVSPADIGQTVEGVQQLIDAFLYDVPNGKLFTGELSLYDIAKWSFGGAITLLEHFRSVPDIIRFSNALSYQGKIKPLREITADIPAPSVVEHRIDAHRVGDVNELEAKTIVALVKSCIEQEEYAETPTTRLASMGVVSFLGDHQARYIEQLLYRVVDPDEIARRRIVVGNASQFQGDERDVMFLSMVYTGNLDGGPLPLMQQRIYKQRINVAASRARNQMWVVHSLNPSTDLKVGDLRRLLIEHAQDPKATLREGTEALARAESEFEVAVIKRLSMAGYHLRTQYPVGSYRIDIVVIGANAERLAVECDGARYHGSSELDHDMQRQADLERLGWRFVRIRGTDFYRDPDAAMQPVFERLASLGIEPLQQMDSSVSVEQTSELLERVRRRGQEIQSEVELALQVGNLLVRSPRSRGRSRRFGGPPRREPAEPAPARAQGDSNGGVAASESTMR
jgi:very-short-patch-repair endonuclease